MAPQINFNMPVEQYDINYPTDLDSSVRQQLIKKAEDIGCFIETSTYSFTFRVPCNRVKNEDLFLRKEQLAEILKPYGFIQVDQYYYPDYDNVFDSKYRFYGSGNLPPEEPLYVLYCVFGRRKDRKI